MSLHSSNNPIRIGYYDPFNIYPKIKDEFTKKLPLTNLHVKLQESQPIKSIPSLSISMFEEVPKKVEIGSGGSSGELAVDNVYTRLMFIKIDSIDNYRSSVRPLIREWLKNIVFKSRSSWMIVMFVPSDVKDTKSMMKVSRFDKLKVDFGVDGKELSHILPGNFPEYSGERCFKFRELGVSKSGVDSCSEFVSEVKRLLLISFTNRYNFFQEWIKQHKSTSVEGFISAFGISELLNDMTLYPESLEAIENVREKLTIVVENNPNIFDYHVNLPKEFKDYTTFESSFVNINIRKQLLAKQDINVFQLYCLIFINYSSVLQALSTSETVTNSSLHVSKLYQQIIVFLNDISGRFPNVDLKEFQYSVVEYYLNLPNVKELIKSKTENEDNINNSSRHIYEFQGELKLFQRSVLSKIAEERNFAINRLTVLQDISLDNTTEITPSPLINPTLTKYMIDKPSYFAAFTSMTEEIIRDFVACDRTKSIDVLSIDLAILNYEKGEYKECLEILQGSYDFFISNGWNYLGGVLLEIYNGCIENLNLDNQYDKEILTTCLKLATCLVKSLNQTSINSYSLIKDKTQIDKLFLQINEFSLKQPTQLECSLDELFETKIHLCLNADTATTRDQYYIGLEINNPFQRPFNFKYIEAVMMSNEGHEIIFTQDNVDISNESKHIIKLYSNTFIMGSFKPNKLSIALNEKLSLVSKYDVNNEETNDTDKATSKEPWYKNSLNTFHNLEKFRCDITCPSKIRFGASEVLLNIHNGNNHVKDVKIKMFSTTDGLKITETKFNIEKLDPKEIKGIIIPYTHASENKLINMKSRIIYQVGDIKYTHEISYDVDTSLTISVSVKDFFKQDFMYSNFQIAASNPKHPIRVIKNQLTTANENYTVTSPKSKLPELIAFGEQPTSIFFRITPKENYTIKNEDKVELIVWYSNLQEECENSLFEQVINQLRDKNLIKYWFMLKDLVFSKVKFDLNKYAINETIEVENREELNSLSQNIFEYVEGDAKELFQITQGILTGKVLGSTTRKVFELDISVPIPIKKYVQIVEYDFERKEQYVVGEPIRVSLNINTINKWSGEDTQTPDEFQAIVQNDDNWLVSGYRKHSFINGNSLKTELLLIPLNVGKILLPKVFVKFLQPVKKEIPEHGSMEVEFKNGMETVLVIPEVNSVTFSF